MSNSRNNGKFSEIYYKFKDRFPCCLNSDSNDEKVLIKWAQLGNSYAFERLILPYQRRVYLICFDLSGSHDDAQDIAQETFIKAYKYLNKYNGNSAFYTWLYRIAVNTWLDHKRQNSRQEYISNYELDELYNSSENFPDIITDSSIKSQYIKKAVETLSTQQKTVFILRFYHELTLSEIAQSLNVTEGTVKTVLFRSLQKLRIILRSIKD